MKTLTILFAIISIFASINAFGGSEDKFLKKYAMMKIYESCFGAEVVRQIRKEMKIAAAKCSTFEESPAVTTQRPPAPQPPQNEGMSEQENAVFNQPGFDAEKLHQAILAYRPAANPFQMPNYRPFNQMPSFYPYANPMYQGNPAMMYNGFPMGAQYNTPYAFPFLGQPSFSGTNRVSRDMDMRNQLDALTSRMSGRVKNVTCVMQELGYLDDNLEPNYEKISERISNLPVSEDLRRDMQDGVTFCQQFSQCVPEVKKDRAPLSRELIRPMFFFKCYKHKKLEACVMKDVREKYAGVGDEDLDEEVEIRRQGKSMKIGTNNADINELASSMYEFLYGDASLDMADSLL